MNLPFAKATLKKPDGTKQPQGSNGNGFEEEEEKEDEDGEEGTRQGDLIQLLHDDNTRVADLFFQYTQAEDDDEKQDLFGQIKLGLKVHAQLAEELYYPLLE